MSNHLFFCHNNNGDYMKPFNKEELLNKKHNKKIVISSILILLMILVILKITSASFNFIKEAKLINSKVSFPIEKIYEYYSTGDYQEFIVPKSGNYKIEAYGSGDESNKGGYATGSVILEKDDILYVYVSDNKWNGGGTSPTTISSGYTISSISCATNKNTHGTNGKGATDVRIIKASDDSWYDTSNDGTTVTKWNEDQSLNSRLVTAGGAGGATQMTSCTAIGGTLTTKNTYATKVNANSYLGKGSDGTGTRQTLYGTSPGGGGGGYYGGKANSGGTSYVVDTYSNDVKTYTINDIETKDLYWAENAKVVITYIDK